MMMMISSIVIDLILKTFSDEKYKDMTMIELGSCQGNSTFVYSNIFKKVYGVEKDSWNIEQAKKKCKDKDNVEFIQKDIYNQLSVCLSSVFHF